MKKNYMHKKRTDKKKVLVISFLALFVLFFLTTRQICVSRMDRRMETARQIAITESDKICNAIESRITIIKAPEMYVHSNQGDLSGFAEAAKFYYEDAPAIRSIQLAPNGVVSQEYTYPDEEGNFVDHDLFADPKRKDEAKLSREEGQILLSGPYTLHQGGEGIIIVNPIYLEGEGGEREFWGFSSVIFNVPQVFDMERMNLFPDEDYSYRLWKEQPGTDKIEVLAENTEGELKDPLRETIEVYTAKWYLDIVPQGGWFPMDLLVLLIGIFSLLLCLAMIGLSSHLKLNEYVYRDGLLKIRNMNALSLFYKNLPSDVREKMFIVAFDIDKFKEFNYIHGVREGDRLLRYVSQTIQEEVSGTSVFRYALDYFIVLNTHESQQECEEQVQKLLHRFSQDVADGVIPPFEISAGIRKIHQGESLQLVINDAFIAREAVKGNALQHYAVYDEETRRARLAQMEMESDFHSAMQNGEFHVFYQPKYNMISGEIIGAEALVRWMKPDGAVISPGAFIPCFEETHQISLLDEFVLLDVCRTMSEMIDEGLTVKPISVNLSRVHLKHSGILSKIEEIINIYHIDPSMISFEITESAIYEDSIPLHSIVDHLHSLGCQVHMDDYGVGVSGPKALASYAFDVVKFDKSFVDDMDSLKVADIIRSTSYLAKQWGMKVIAEGVETKEQARKLVGMGCTRGQGYYYSKPIPKEDYRNLLIVSAENQPHHARRMKPRSKFFSEEVKALFDSNPLPAYIINPKNFVVVHTNQEMQKLFGEELVGGRCYEKMRGATEPCKNCIAMKLYWNGDETLEEILSDHGGWLRIQAKSVFWRGGYFIQVSCMDISRQKQLEDQLRALTGKKTGSAL